MTLIVVVVVEGHRAERQTKVGQVPLSKPTLAQDEIGACPSRCLTDTYLFSPHPELAHNRLKRVIVCWQIEEKKKNGKDPESI